MRHLRQLVPALLATMLVLPATALAVDAPAPPADGELVLVVAITDGDTIRVERDSGAVERVRYIGIDTPEISHEAGEPDEPWGPEATVANAEMVEDQVVLLERDISETDRYDRLLRYVWVEGDEGWSMVNAELVALGLADVRAYEPDTTNDAWFRQLQEEARDAGRGMYGEAPESGSIFDDIHDFFFGD
jgi:micrococcal nuclease